MEPIAAAGQHARMSHAAHRATTVTARMLSLLEARFRTVRWWSRWDGKGCLYILEHEWCERVWKSRFFAAEVVGSGACARNDRHSALLFDNISDLQSGNDIEESVGEIIASRSWLAKLISRHSCNRRLRNITHVSSDTFFLELLRKLLGV